MTITTSQQYTFLNFLTEDGNTEYVQEVILKDPCIKSITSSINHLDSVLPDLRDTELDIQRHMGLEHFNLYTGDLGKSLRGHKQSLIDAVINYTKKEFPSVVFNKTMLRRFAFYMQPFDGETFISYIRKTYKDTDILTLELWQYVILSEMVGGGWIGDHYIHWYEKSGEHIKDINSAGIELSCYSRDFYTSALLNYVVKFCQFVFSEKKLPLHEYSGWEEVKDQYKLDNIEQGKAYTTKELKSIRYYPNKNILKIGFKSPEDRQKFKDLLFTPAWAILEREEPEKVGLNDVCDICLYKNVLCLECRNYSAWTGSCKFCTHRKEYDIYGKQECEACFTGAANKFEPMLDAEKVNGLVKVDGYSLHTWKARVPMEDNLQLIHCFDHRIRYRSYTRSEFPAWTCGHCRYGVREKEGDAVRHVCISENEKYFVWNCRGTLATSTTEAKT